MAKRSDPFARVDKKLLDDPELSWRAKGVMAYLLGKPSGWKLRVSDLQKHGKEGRNAIRTVLDELRSLGYAEFVQTRGEKGVFEEGTWKISDSPIFQPRTGNPRAVKPKTDSRYHSKKECTENDGTKNEKSKEDTSGTPSPSVEDALAVFSAVWKPIEGTKADQLKRIRPPKGYPSEREFDTFIDSAELDEIGMGKRGDLYAHLCDVKWHHWTHNRRWRPIRDWQAYVKALDTKIAEATVGG